MPWYDPELDEEERRRRVIGGQRAPWDLPFDEGPAPVSPGAAPLANTQPAPVSPRAVASPAEDTNYRLTTPSAVGLAPVQAPAPLGQRPPTLTKEDYAAVAPHGLRKVFNLFGEDIRARNEVTKQREREQSDYDVQLAQRQKEEAAAKGKFRPAVLADEEGRPIAASFDPATGTYHDDAGNPIANPRQWEKPPARTTGRAEPLYDKNGTVIGFRDLEGNLIGPHSPNATAEMKDILDSAQPKAPPSEAGKIAPEIEAQIGTRPDPKDYPQGAKDPEYKTASTAWGAAAEKIKNREAAATGEARGMAYGRGRFYSMLDTEGGNVPVMVTGEEIQDHPGRYISAGAGAPALTKTALIEDIRGAIGLTRESIGKMGNESFNKTQRAWLAAGLAAPAGQGLQYIDSLLRENLTEAQHDYVIRLFQLKENAMAMRTVLGAGQGSEDLRNAIIATLPGAGTPTKEYATKQLQAFESQLNRLERGVPKVPLRTDIGGAGAGGTEGKAGAVSDAIKKLRESKRAK